MGRWGGREEREGMGQVVQGLVGLREDSPHPHTPGGSNGRMWLRLSQGTCPAPFQGCCKD